MRFTLSIYLILFLLPLNNCDNSFKEDATHEIIYAKSKSENSLQDTPAHIQNTCLPIPGEAFIYFKNDDSENYSFLRENNSGFKTDIVYHYLTMQLDSTAEKKIIATDGFWGVITWSQNFERGIMYRHHDHVEAGSSGELYTRCTDRNAFYSSICPVIEEKPQNGFPPHVWKKDSSLYEPKNPHPGCYYEVKKIALVVIF